MTKTLKQYLSLRGLLARCEHEWLLQRSIGGSETAGNMTFKYGSRLIKWCGKCGKATSPTKEELKDNPPIFEQLKAYD